MSRFEKSCIPEDRLSASNKGQGDNETVCGDGTWCGWSESLSDRKYLR